MFILELCKYDPDTANFGDLDNDIYEVETIACSRRPQTLEDYWNERKDLSKYQCVVHHEIKKIDEIVD